MSSNSRQSKSRGVLLFVKQHLGNIASRLAFLVLLVGTFSYHGRLQNFTIRPIEAIARQSNNSDQLRAALGYFRTKKQKDLDFVRPASTLSAIAVIGIFSWPSVADSFWVARVFLYWSLSFSFFSLISSTIDQLLEFIPAPDDETVAEKDHAAILSLLVHPKALTSEPSSESLPNVYRPKWLMVYVWQCPAMLMSWSWVLFYAGFILYILTPVIPHERGMHDIQMVTAVMVVCGLTIANFFLCSILASFSLEQLRQNRDSDETVFDDGHNHEGTKKSPGPPSTSSPLFRLTRRATPEVFRDSFQRFVAGGLTKNNGPEEIYKLGNRSKTHETEDV